MALSLNNNALQELIAVGADAITSLYDVEIALPGDELVSSQQLRVRATGFTPPSTAQQTYDVSYKGSKLTRPKPALEVGQTFDITFRMDAYYDVYKALCGLQNRTSNPMLGYASSALPAESELATVKVNVLTSPLSNINSSAAATAYTSANSTPMYVYKGCWISKITKPQFKSADASAVEITATFNYLYAEDPQTGTL